MAKLTLAKSSFIGLRVPPAEREALDRAAVAAGVTLSQFLRRAAMLEAGPYLAAQLAQRPKA